MADLDELRARERETKARYDALRRETARRVSRDELFGAFQEYHAAVRDRLGAEVAEREQRLPPPSLEWRP